MRRYHRALVRVPVTGIETLADGRVRFTMIDGRKLTMDPAAIEIAPGHVFMPAAFAAKINAPAAFGPENTQALP